MSTDNKTDEKKKRLLSLLQSMFQLDQPDLDFGLYRIMHAKKEQVQTFLNSEFDQLIDKTFAHRGAKNEEAAKKEYEEAKKQAIDFGAPDPEVAPKVQQAKTRWDSIRMTGGDDAEIYDHLYRFFSRYYEDGDFMALRRYGKGSAGGAETYAVPYDGSEVMMHWTNRDQYYIKSTENFSRFSFDPRLASNRDASGVSRQLFENTASGPALKVHFQLVDVEEGGHNNVKASDKDERYFMVNMASPIRWEGSELVVEICYQTDPEKTGQKNKWQDRKNDQIVEKVLESLLTASEEKKSLAREYHTVLGREVQSGKDNRQALLARYLNQFTCTNTMDYFIHRDLGEFLFRELDFYIKNEILKLDDFFGSENSEVTGNGPSEQKIKAIATAMDKAQAMRLLSQRLITFLAQLEDFQKKLWLKKKFVIETNYCITLDRIPEAFYADIALCDAQRKEWVVLFGIEKISGDMATIPYSEPLNATFLKANPYLLVDTNLLPQSLREEILESIDNLDDQCSGVLIHSENFQALTLAKAKLQKSLDCIYADPPYNTTEESFVYKNQYRHSSWLSMIFGSSSAALPLIKHNGQFFMAIDDAELYRLKLCLDSIVQEGYVGTLAIQTNPRGRGINSHFATSHDYCLVYSPSPDEVEIMDQPLTEEQAESYKHGDGEEAYRLLPFRRSGGLSTPHDRPNSEFSLYFHKQTRKLCAVGGERSKSYPADYESLFVLSLNEEGDQVESQMYEEFLQSRSADLIKVMPIDGDGRRRVWRWSDREKILKAGHLGDFVLSQQGAVQLKDRIKNGRKPKTLWFDSKYDASSHGTNLIQDILGGRGEFAYPKSINTVRDTIYCAIGENKNGTILDYFGGSGTTGHAVVELNRSDAGNRKFYLIEMADYFHAVLVPRIKRVIYSKSWKDGNPVDRKGISSLIKIVRLESYEDCLNNLTLNATGNSAQSVENESFRRDYLLNYVLDVETRGSQSLLNVDQFKDPLAYSLNIKKPGSDEHMQVNADLIETFNWLIGITVECLHKGQKFSATFVRKPDPLLQDDANTKLEVESLTEESSGNWWFRAVVGYISNIPGDNRHRQSVLVLWRNQTGDAEQDAAVLTAYLAKQMKFDLTRKDDKTHYDVIYINGSHNLPNLGRYGEVRLLEEEFHRRMWAGE